jgi:hypothetical protein
VISSAKKTAAKGAIVMAVAWGLFTGWIMLEMFSRMNGEQLSWMLVFWPLVVFPVALLLGSINVLLSIALFLKNRTAQISLAIVALIAQIFCTILMFSGEWFGASEVIFAPFIIGSASLWAIAIVTHGVILENSQKSDLDR